MSNPLPAYPKRLIEVDLPIFRISAHARREKSIRHGHISTLHIWWARRPLAACRAVICARSGPIRRTRLSGRFPGNGTKLMRTWAADHGKLQGTESFTRFNQIQQKPPLLDYDPTLRQALLDFIADFANWDNSTVPEYLETSRASPRPRMSRWAAARHPAARCRSVCWGRLDPARSPTGGCRRLCQRPQPRPRAAQQGRPRIHP